MILASPEFDTYGSIRRLAEHPDDDLAYASFRLLLRRTESHVLWRAGDRSHNLDDLKQRMKLLTGITELPDIDSDKKEDNVMTPEKLASMSHDDRMAFMDAQLKAAGLDPSAFIAENRQGQASK